MTAKRQSSALVERPRSGRSAPEAVVSVVAIVGASATEAVGKPFTEAAGWLEYPEERVAGSPGTQARTACSNGDAEDRDRPLHVVGQNVKAHRGSHPIECPGQELAATHP